MKSHQDRSSSHETPEQILQSIKTHQLEPPFVQAFNPTTGLLRYGCGDGSKGVQIDSERNIFEAVNGVQITRLHGEMVQRLRSGGSKVVGNELYDSVRKTIYEYVHFQDERVYSLIALWTIGTYTYRMFSHYGYLFVHSTLPQSGKTRLLEILHHLAFEATVPLNAPTAASIRENATAGGTLLLDTLERWRERSGEGYSAAMEMLDAGFRRGGTVTKMIPSADGAWSLTRIPVFAPYGLAGISRDSLADTALDRSFVIEMSRKSIAIKKQPYW